MFHNIFYDIHVIFLKFIGYISDQKIDLGSMEGTITLFLFFKGYNIPTANCPQPILWLTSFFDRTIKMVLPDVGKVYKFDNTRVRVVYIS